MGGLTFQTELGLIASAMNTDLLAYVLHHLKSRQPAWTEVARASGVPYDTLK
jgi:hypothetical protein